MIRRRAAILLCGGVGAALLTACEPSDPVSEAIREAELSLRQAAMSGDDESRRRTYEELAGRLGRQASSDAHPASLAELKRLEAEALAGQAGVRLGRATAAIAELSSASARAEADLARIESLASLLDAVGSYDASAERNRLTSRQDELRREAEALEAASAAAEAEVTRLLAQAAAERGLARSQSAQEQQIRIEASDADPIRRASLIERAAERRRAAAEHERAEALVTLQAEDAAKRLADLRGDLARVTAALASVDASVGRLEARLAAVDGQRAELAAEIGGADGAGGVRADLAASVNRMSEIYNDRVSPELDAAAQLFTRASQAAGRARSDGGDAAKLTIASMDHGLHQVRVVRASTLTGLVGVASRAAASDAAGGGARFGDLLSRLEASLAEAEAALGESAEKASSSLGSVRGDAFRGLADRVRGGEPDRGDGGGRGRGDAEAGDDEGDDGS